MSEENQPRYDEEPPVPEEPVEEPPAEAPVEEPPAEAPKVEEPTPEEPTPEEPPVPEEPDLTGEIAQIHAALADVESIDEGSGGAALASGEGGASDASSDDYFTDELSDGEGGELGEHTAVLPVIAGPLEAEPEPIAGPAAISMPERRSNAWVWAGLVVGVLVAAGAVGYAWWYTTSRPIVVPSLVGKLPAPAVQTINDADLRLGKVSEVPTDGAPPGTVIAQTPEAFTKLKPDAAVSIVLAAAPTGAKVPNVMGQSVDVALATLAKERLVGMKVQSYTTSGTAGTLVSQLPTAGAELEPGSAVVLVVSKGLVPTQLRVPGLIGLSETDASNVLKAAGLRSDSFRSYNASVTAGIVTSQTPNPNMMLSYDSAVQYVVSGGPGAGGTQVPSLVGLTRQAAEKKLKGLGLKAKARTVISAGGLKGKVTQQTPVPGSRVARGSTVGIMVARGVVSAQVPSIAGMTSEDASKAVGAAGYGPVMVGIATTQYPAGQAFGQYPAAGTPWALRLPVVVVFAKP